MSKLILSISDLPTDEEEPELYSAAASRHLPRVFVFQIINEIRKFDPIQLTAPQCRNQLAKLKSIVESMDFMQGLDKLTTNETEHIEEEP